MSSTPEIEQRPVVHPAPTGTTAEAVLEVGRPVAACYNQLLRVEQIPRFLDGVQKVKRLGNRLTRWTVDATADEKWTVEFHGLDDDAKIAWRRLDGPRHEGHVLLEAVGPERTLVRLRLEGEASGGPLANPGQLEENLRRFKRLVEARPRSIGARPRRVDMRCERVGFTPPPCALHMKFTKTDERWSLVALSPPGRPPVVARWLEAFSPSSIEIPTGLSPKMLRATFERLPASWEELVSSVHVRYLVLTPDGTASLFIEGPPYRGERYLSKQQLLDPKVRGRRVNARLEKVPLTARQAEILSLAVAAGYYEVPHKLNLRSLAAKLGLSLGTVAEALRRAESHILTAYVDMLTQTRWADSRPPESGGHGANGNIKDQGVAPGPLYLKA